MQYQKAEATVIEFEAEDIVVASVINGDTGCGLTQQDIDSGFPCNGVSSHLVRDL